MQKLTPNSAASESLRWDDVRYFLELARLGTLSAAARALQVEHSTVARRVDALEKRVSLRLFDRLPKCWTITPEGEALLQHALRIEEEAHAFSRASLGVASLRGTVRISATPVFASHFLTPRLAELYQQWPDIALEIVGEIRIANLFRREADLALRYGRPSEPGLAARQVAEVGFGLYAGTAWQGHPHETWKVLGYDDSMRDIPQQQWLDQQVVRDQPYVLRSNDVSTLYQACRANLGITILPNYLARNDPALFRIPGIDCPVKLEIWMVVHPDVRRSPRVKAVADSISDLLKKHQEILQ